VYSAGLLVVYGGQPLIEANADWRGYDLSAYPERHLALDLACVLAIGTHWSGLAAGVASPLAVHPAPLLTLVSDGASLLAES
jgi:hypothetical protein